MNKYAILRVCATFLLIGSLLLQSTLPIFDLLPIPRIWHITAQSVPAQGGEQVFLPKLAVTRTSDFSIIAPLANSTVGGTINFAIQPADANLINSVRFMASDTELGVVSRGSDGFRVFVDTSKLPAGKVQLTAIASGPGGDIAKDVEVNVVSSPPATAKLGSDGGVLQTPDGSTISFLPGTIPPDTTIRVSDRTQEQVTAQNGIDWDSLGVTFLGAQVIESSAPFSGPIGMVASAGFGNRVQPGQAVVNYQLIDDANGDGVDEIVVVNTASVAQNGNVVANPIRPIQVYAASTHNQAAHALQSAEIAIQGPPGVLVDFSVSGFNLFSSDGNTAHFKSLVGDEEITVAGRVFTDPTNSSKQILRVALPYFPTGAATVSFRNESTGMDSAAIPITIDPLPDLNRPARVVFQDYFNTYLLDLQDSKNAIANDVSLQAMLGQDIDLLISEITTARDALDQAFMLLERLPEPEVQKYLDDAAKIVEVADVGDVSTASMIEALPVNCDFKANDKVFRDFYNDLADAVNPTPISQNGEVDPVSLATSIADSEVAEFLDTFQKAWSIARGVRRIINYLASAADYAYKKATGQCDEEPKPEPPQPTPETGSGGGGSGGSGSGPTTGMGSAPPPGGSGAGHSGGGSGGQLAALDAAQDGPTIVKVYSGRGQVPFTGMVDPGGYFFIPFIPYNEPFVALAINTATQQLRIFTGIGPATSKSVFMWFDFSNDSRGTPIPIEANEVVSGTISQAGEVDFYSFVATPGQQVFFQMQDAASLNDTVTWQFIGSDGTQHFNECVTCDNEPLLTLKSGGIYLLAVGNAKSTDTGSYRFKLWNVPNQTFDIKIGDLITPDQPVSGMGRLESPRIKDIYRFTAKPGQQILAEVESTTLTGEVWTALHQGDRIIDSMCFNGLCYPLAVQTLSEGGTYEFVVGNDTGNVVGGYKLKLWNVPPPQTFNIAIGDEVSNGNPAAGAGKIESPGAKDIYRFTADPEQRIMLQIEAVDMNGEISVELKDELETVAVYCFNGICGTPPIETLTRGGTYELIIGNNAGTVTGTYYLKLWEPTESQEFNIQIGSKVSDRIPVAGAGNIESPQVQDVYIFNATAGQTIYFDEGPEGACENQLSWRLERPDGSNQFDDWFGGDCDTGSITLDQTGIYRLVVYPWAYYAVGPYSFELRAGSQ